VEADQDPDAPILRVKYPYTVSPYIPGPTMEDLFRDESNERSNAFNIAIQKLSAELNHRLGFNMHWFRRNKYETCSKLDIKYY